MTTVIKYYKQRGQNRYRFFLWTLSFLKIWIHFLIPDVHLCNTSYDVGFESCSYVYLHTDMFFTYTRSLVHPYHAIIFQYDHFFLNSLLTSHISPCVSSSTSNKKYLEKTRKHTTLNTLHSHVTSHLSTIVYLCVMGILATVPPQSGAPQEIRPY